MFIIEHGDSAVIEKFLKRIDFRCPFCKCRFIADKTEYEYVGKAGSVALGGTVSMYACKCPECRNNVTKKIRE